MKRDSVLNFFRNIDCKLEKTIDSCVSQLLLFGNASLKFVDNKEIVIAFIECVL